MSKGDEMKVSSETAISMPMKNLLSIVAAVAVGVWAYFGVIERLNRIETNEELLRKDLTQATQRIESTEATQKIQQFSCTESVACFQ